MGDVHWFASPESAIPSYAAVWRENVFQPLAHHFESDVWHFGSSDTTEFMRRAESIGRHALAVVHDPGTILGRPDWRRPKPTPQYVAWRTRSGLMAHKSRSLAFERFEWMTTTSKAAESANKRLSFVSPLGTSVRESPRERLRSGRVGVVGHLHPSRGLADFLSVAASLQDWTVDIVGRCTDDDFLAHLKSTAKSLPVTVVPNASADQLAELRDSWDALVVLPARERSLSASLSVVEALAHGVPVVYPEKSQVSREYVGPAGAGYASTRDLQRCLDSIAERIDDLGPLVLDWARSKFSWSVVCDQWQAFLSD